MGVEIGGKWSLPEKALHINCLELLAVKNAIPTFTKNKQLDCIYIQMDKTAVLPMTELLCCPSECDIFAENGSHKKLKFDENKHRNLELINHQSDDDLSQTPFWKEFEK